MWKARVKREYSRVREEVAKNKEAQQWLSAYVESREQEQTEPPDEIEPIQRVLDMEDSEAPIELLGIDDARDSGIRARGGAAVIEYLARLEGDALPAWYTKARLTEITKGGPPEAETAYSR